jgi:hypothetical protein
VSGGCAQTKFGSTTLRPYFHEYQQGGIERLKQLHFYQPQSALTPPAARLGEHFPTHPIAPIAQAQAVIDTSHGHILTY